MEDTPRLHWTPRALPRREAIHGRTVSLQPLNATQHCGPLWEAVKGHDDLWEYLFDGPYATELEFAASLEHKQTAPGFLFYAIVPQHTAAARGYASYLRMEPNHGVMEIGNVLFSPSLQRTTAATEAIYLMACYTFENLGYRRLEWKCNAENAPSRRAAQRLGFQFEGIFRQHMVVKDHNRDTAWFAMLDHEWPARKEAFEKWLAPENFDGEGKQLQPLAQHGSKLH